MLNTAHGQRSNNLNILQYDSWFWISSGWLLFEIQMFYNDDSYVLAKVYLFLSQGLWLLNPTICK